MKSRMRKVMSILLASAMLVTNVPSAAFAESEEKVTEEVTEKKEEAAPETQPETQPETSAPEPAQEETSAPETQPETQPETSAPEPAQEETSAPETQPETSAPEPAQEETSAPETSAPAETAPETAQTQETAASSETASGENAETAAAQEEKKDETAADTEAKTEAKETSEAKETEKKTVTAQKKSEKKASTKREKKNAVAEGVDEKSYPFDGSDRKESLKAEIESSGKTVTKLTVDGTENGELKNVKAAGAYVVVATVATDQGTEDLTFNVTIQPKTVDITWVPDTATAYYSGTAQKPISGSYKDINDATVNLTADEIVVSGAPAVNAGTYEVTAQLTNKNYVASADNKGDFTIEKKPITLNWDNATTVFTYDGTEKKPVPVISDNVSADVISVSGATDAGSHTAVASIANDNYTFATNAVTEQTYTINKASAAIIWSWTDPTYYDGEAHYPVATYSDVNDTTVTVTNVTEATGKKPVDAGAYTFTADPNNANYTFTNLQSNSFTITAASRTVTWEWTTPTYFNGREQYPKASYTDVSGQKKELTVSAQGGTSINAKNYTAQAAKPTDSNYTFNDT